MSITAVPLQPTPKRVLWYLWVGIALLVLGGVWFAVSGTAAVVAQKGTNAQFLAWNKRQPGVVETASGLQYKVLKPGEDARHPTDADVAAVTYVGRFRDGKVFDATQQQPAVFPLAPGSLVPGFSEGIKLMTKGARYRIWMKPELAYGAHPEQPGMRPDALLIFDVDMLGFLPASVYQQMQMQQQGGGAPPGGGAPGAGPGPGGAAPPAPGR